MSVASANVEKPAGSNAYTVTRPRKWVKQWVQQESVLNNGKCFLLKWVTEGEAKVPPMPPVKIVVETPPPPQLLPAQPRASSQITTFVCHVDGCGKVFTDAGALRKHAHVHGERQYVCQYEGCGKKFVDSSKLKRHHLIHTGEKHFICPFEGCGKAFSLDFNRRSHMRTHTGENYHTCPIADCGKRFAHENKLRAHMQTAHMEKENGTESEREESKVSKVESGVGNRGDSDTNRPFSCPHDGCGKRYIHEYKLKLHLGKEHGGSGRDMDDSRSQPCTPARRRGESDSEEDELENIPLIFSHARDSGNDGNLHKKRKKQKRKDGDDKEKKKRGRPPKDKILESTVETEKTNVGGMLGDLSQWDSRDDGQEEIPEGFEEIFAMDDGEEDALHGGGYGGRYEGMGRDEELDDDRTDHESDGDP